MHAVTAKEIAGATGGNRSSASLPDWLLDRSIAQSYRWFGVSDSSARVTLAIYVLAVVLILFFVARRFLGGGAAGLYAGLVILLWPGTYWDAHLFSPSWLWPLAAPIVALFVGYLLAREEAAPGGFGRRFATVVLIVGVAGAIVLGVLAFRIHAPVSRHVPVDTTALRVPLLVAAAAMLAGVIVNFLLRRRNQARLANCFLAGAAGGLLIAFHVSLVMLSPSFSSQILSDAIRPELASNDIVLINGTVDEASSFVFYMDRPVSVLSTFTSAPASTSTPGGVPSDASIAQVWNGPGRVFLWTKIEHAPILPGSYYKIAQTGDKEIVSNQPNSAGAEF